MKKLVVIVCLLLGNVVYGQRTLTSDQAIDPNITREFRNGEKISEFILKDGTIIKEGSKLVMGKPRNPLTLVYDYVYVGYMSLLSEMVSPSATLTGNYDGLPVTVDYLKVYKRKLSRSSEIQVYAFVYNPSQTSLTGDKYRTITDLELGISGGEIINPNAALTREQAILKLKESKDLLDLGLLTQEEYNKIKAELTPIIMKNN